MKLTNEMRDETISRSIAATFSERDKAMAKARVTFADSLYAHSFGSVERQALKMPKQWFHFSDSIHVTCKGFSHRWGSQQTSDAPSGFQMSKERPMPKNINDGFTIKAEHPLWDGAQLIAQEFRSIQDAKAELKQNLNSLLRSVTTLARLAEVWPEGKKFFPREQQKVALPVRFDLAANINAMMGLKALKIKTPA